MYIMQFWKILSSYPECKHLSKGIINSAYKEEKGVWPSMMNRPFLGRYGRAELYRKKEKLEKIHAV